MASSLELLSKTRVLIVEDQQEARAILRLMLGELGITQIYEASDGKQASEFMDAAAEMVDMIVCDWNMPNMSGIELLKEMRKKSVNVPFLMVTGRGDMSSVVDARDGGVSGYIKKPFSPAQLEVKLRVCMERQKKAA